MIQFKNDNVQLGYDQLREEIKDFLDALQWHVAEFVITSTIRTPAENAAVGGSPKSKHLIGGAVDIRTSNLTTEDKKDVMDVANFFELKCIDEGDHLHIQIK